MKKNLINSAIFSGAIITGVVGGFILDRKIKDGLFELVKLPIFVQHTAADLRKQKTEVIIGKYHYLKKKFGDKYVFVDSQDEERLFSFRKLIKSFPTNLGFFIIPDNSLLNTEMRQLVPVFSGEKGISYLDPRDEGAVLEASMLLASENEFILSQGNGRGEGFFYNKPTEVPLDYFKEEAGVYLLRNRGEINFNNNGKAVLVPVYMPALD